MSPDALALGLLYYVVFLFSTTFHEAAHAWAAMRGGDLTAYHGGQVSLDPRPHIRREPFGMLILPLVTTLTSGWQWVLRARRTIRDGRFVTLVVRGGWPSQVPQRTWFSSSPPSSSSEQA